MRSISSKGRKTAAVSNVTSERSARQHLRRERRECIPPP